MTAWRDPSTQDNYKTADNLRARAALFQFVVEAPNPPPPINWFTWPAGARVLDVGCGTGMWLRAARGAGAEVVGLDLSEAMLAATREAAPETPLVRAGAAALPFATGSFHAVLALWMLYHVDDKPSALREFSRVLAPGGHVIAATNADGRTQQIDEIACDAIGEITGTRPDRWFPALDFNAENGEETFASVFTTVEANHYQSRFEVTVPDVVAGYVGSMAGVLIERYPAIDVDAVLAGVRRRAADDIARRGYVEIISRSACFRAS